MCKKAEAAPVPGPWHQWVCFWGNISFLEPEYPELHNTKSSNSFSGTFLTPRRCFLLAASSHEMNDTSFPSARAGLFSRLTGFGIAAWMAGFPSGWACSLCQPGQPEPQQRPLRAPSLKQGFPGQPGHHHRAQNLKLPQPQVKSLGTTCVCFCSKAGKQGVCSEVSLGKGEVINESGS